MASTEQKETPASAESQEKLSEATGKCETPTPTPRRRKIIIDPAFILFFTFYISGFPLANQYIYYAIGEKYNLSAVLEGEDSSRANGSDPGGMCGEDKNSTAYKLQQQVQAESATFNLYLDLVTDVPGFFVVLFYGTLMDKFGRKPTLVIPLVGAILRSLIYALQQVLHMPLETLFLGSAIDVVFGGIPTFMTTCYAYFADTVEGPKRGHRLAIVDVFSTVGLACMQIGMGFIIQYHGFVWPYVLILAGHSVNLLYVIFFVPESMTRASTKSWRSVSPTYIIRSFKVLPKTRPNNGRLLLIIFLGSWCTVQFGAMARYSLESLYKLNSPFCWSATLLGAFNGSVNVLNCVAQVLITVLLLRRLGEINVIHISLVSFAFYFFLQSFATTNWMLYVAAVMGMANGIYIPLCRAVFSKLVTSEEQGALFSSIAAIDNLLRICGSAMFNPLYGATLFVFKGTVFVVMGALVIIGEVLLIVFQGVRKKEERKGKMENELKQYDNPMIYSIQL